MSKVGAGFLPSAGVAISLPPAFESVWHFHLELLKAAHQGLSFVAATDFAVSTYFVQ